MNLSWDLIRTFKSVAKTGSLSAASRELGLTQPTVGRHIDLLEDALKIPLFIRSREGMKITDQGSDLVLTADEMAISANEFERRAAGFDETVEGLVRISANEIFGVLILPRILPIFAQHHPNVEIELIVSNTASNLLQRDADVAIRMFRPRQNDLVARKIADLPLGLFAHEDYLQARFAPKRLSDLHDHNIIGFDRETSLIEVARQLGEEFKPSDFIFRCDSILSHIEAIRSGLGIGVTHQGLARRWPGVIRVLPDLALPDLDLWIACHADVHYNKRIRLVMDFLAQQLKRPYECLKRV